MQRSHAETEKVVAYHLGGRLGHGMWPSVVGWIFGTVARCEKIKTPKFANSRSVRLSDCSSHDLLARDFARSMFRSDLIALISAAIAPIHAVNYCKARPH